KTHTTSKLNNADNKNDKPIYKDPDPLVLLNGFSATGLTQIQTWKQSKFDGMWTATARIPVGQNEVSCLLESSSPEKVQKVTVEAEVNVKDESVSQLVLQFAKSLRALMREMPDGLAKAIASQGSWENDNWRFEKEAHPRGGGYDLRLQSK
ncbi:MAG: hypothetical protein RL148_379, partial [Planctomycetota bacterium]